MTADQRTAPAGCPEREADLRAASVRNPNAIARPIAIATIETSGRYHSHAMAITSGAMTAVTTAATRADRKSTRLNSSH